MTKRVGYEKRTFVGKSSTFDGGDTSVERLHTLVRYQERTLTPEELGDGQLCSGP